MKNRIISLLKIRYPILLGGMAGVSDAVLSAAVSEAGGLGTIGAAKESAKSLKKEIDRLEELTDKPFAVNIPLIAPNVHELISTTIESHVPVVVTAAGNASIYANPIKDGGSVLIHVVPCVDLARRAEDAGVDAVIAEGFESGGFASPHEIGTLVLIPSVVDAVRIPVIAAGGIVDARGYTACLALGAEGVSVGTAFLAAKECSRIGPAWRRQILNANDTSTKVMARGLLPIRLLNNSSANELEKMVTGGAGRKDVMNYIFSADWLGEGDAPFPAGQGVGLIGKIRTATEIMDAFVDGSNKLLKTMSDQQDN